MTEYIDREKAENAINLHRCDTSRIEEAILHIPSANVIPIPEGATNGDMIKAMFPNLKVEIEGTHITCWIDEHKWFAPDYDWWNAPYKGVRE